MVVGDGWYCLGKWSVWREHEILVLLLGFLLVDLFLKEREVVVGVEVFEPNSLKEEDGSFVLIHVFDAVDAMVLYFEFRSGTFGCVCCSS